MKKSRQVTDFQDDMFEPAYTSMPPVKMDELQSMKLLDKLEHLIRIANDCRLSDDFFNMHHDIIQSVADELQLSLTETVMLAPFINDSDSFLYKNDIVNFFGCSPITMMRRSEDLQNLLHRRYLIHRQPFRENNYSYSLNPVAEKAFCKNEALPIIKTTGLDAMEFMKCFNQFVLDAKRLNIIDEDDLAVETMDLIKGNQHLAIAREIDMLPVSDTDKLVALYFCRCIVIKTREGVPMDEVNRLLDDPNICNDIVGGTHYFIQQGLLSPMDSDNILHRDVYKLSAKGRKLFLSEYDIKTTHDKIDFEHIKYVKSNDIKSKTMFYSSDDQHQIDTLSQLLDDKQLKAIRKRLEQANLRKGFNCLFYGGPGTGKTETALQLARSTGRDIMQVDISSIRDKWYGETEKIVQGIFADYATLVKKSRRIPILLINEADAILSVRTTVGGNNPSIEKTENAIQNILLQAMEDIDGIMIATTNLTCNLDSAFDRRFLYKVEFHQPTIEAKTNIWKSFITDLSDADAVTLARAYDFSGGQIENIARKVMVDYLLFGGTPDLHRIEELCAKEQIAGRSANSRRPIGFSK